ncbi:MAG: C4-dicarboxylate ABC transporter [Gammaproteobacteria bacterium MedPE]|nr:MAG: C4-dicarboxylate ABC transporter [Gammaproteobacteria bacterium MedPE]
MIIFLKDLLGKVIDFVGILVACSVITLLGTIFYNVVNRYLFDDVDIGLQELEWHLFACMFLFGMGYSLKENAHVRVDVIYEKLGKKAQAAINLFGTLTLLIPISLLIIYYGYDFANEAFLSNERSGDPGGLTHRWIIKGAIPASFCFTILCAIYVILEQLNILTGGENADEETQGEAL